MTQQDKEQLKLEIDHIFESGANEIRIFEMVVNFIDSRNGVNKNFVLVDVSSLLKSEREATKEEYGLFGKEHQRQQCFLYSVSDRTSSNNRLKIEAVYDGISTAVTQYKITDDLGSIWMQGTRNECERYLYGR